jgi:hypothetical protein
MTSRYSDLVIQAGHALMLTASAVVSQRRDESQFDYPLFPLSSIALSTSDASNDKCAASRSNSSRFFGSVAKSRISAHSAASLRNFSNCASMSCIDPLLSHWTTATTIDHSIFCDVQQRSNDPATGSVRDKHRASVHPQIFEFERGHFDEAISSVGRDAFLTMDDLAASAGALDHGVRAAHSNNLSYRSSAVSIQPVYRDGHRVTGCQLPYLLAIVAAGIKRPS